ncbi:endonuclease/exonuclease/phosphatase family protein [Nocardia sp. CA-290969]|uniref:endonuclease/exonuclease/phosphatase family protein n=1 Tax=Nocardia sp. CA-290969 TaxID=3239986 RepID=UPI003D8D8228
MAVADGLRVVTFNVLAPSYADWPARRRVIAGGLAELRPDIVALQEVTIAPELTAVTELLGPGWELAPHTRSGPDGVGAVLASRWPLGSVHQVDLEFGARAGDFPWSGAVIAEVHTPPPLGTVLVVHHKPVFQLGYEYERERQAVIAAQFVEELLGGCARHVVVLGDFDAGPEASSLRYWTGRQSLNGTSVSYQDAWESAHPDTAGHTFTPANPLVGRGDMPLVPGRRIDHILVRNTHYGPTLEVRECTRIFVEPRHGIQASDHYGLLAELAVPARSPGIWDRPERGGTTPRRRTPLP